MWLIHLEHSGYKFLELFTWNISQHIGVALTVFHSYIWVAFEHLQNTLDQQAASIYTLAQYTETIQTGAEEIVSQFRVEITKLR
jgi:hypothetical protein